MDHIKRDRYTHGSTCHRRRFSLGTNLAVDPVKHRMFAVLLWALRVPLASAASRFSQSREPHAGFYWEEAFVCLWLLWLDSSLGRFSHGGVFDIEHKQTRQATSVDGRRAWAIRAILHVLLICVRLGVRRYAWAYRLKCLSNKTIRIF